MSIDFYFFFSCFLGGGLLLLIYREAILLRCVYSGISYFLEYIFLVD